MGQVTARSHQRQQLVRIKNDLEEILADSSIDRESVRPAIEYVRAVRNGGDPYPEELLTYYIKKTRPRYFAGLTPTSIILKSIKIANKLYEAGKIEKRAPLLGRGSLYLDEGDTETRQNIDEYLEKHNKADGRKKKTGRHAQSFSEYEGQLIEWGEIVGRTGVPSKFLKKVKGIHLLGRLIIVENGEGEEMREGYKPQKAKEFIKTYQIK